MNPFQNEKNILIVIIAFLILSGIAQEKNIPQKLVSISISKPNKPACGDSGTKFRKTDNWYNDKNKATIINYDFKHSKSLEVVKKLYTMKNGVLYYKKNKIDSLQIFYRLNEEIDYVIYIIKGKATGYTINVNNNPRPSMYSVSSNAQGDVRYDFITQNVLLLQGNGILKNYYYGEWNGKTQNYSKEILKSEGEIKNNFKFGEWKYYNKEGKIDSTKIYTLKDSVDVRFPYCIFNKIEPCH
ncbi:hypothetical protein ACFSJW_19170 [Flavobacterium artemisiae]|uniref:MORN repeat variant n=1 Tax=Flavobacterium artemisiae TaxID=2126556 RepID=A0ABW4HL48_9FLAO